MLTHQQLSSGQESCRQDMILSNMLEKRQQFKSPSDQKKIESEMSDIVDSPKYIPVQNKKGQKKEKGTFRNLLRSKGGFNLVWKISALRIVYLITRFIIKLRTSSQQYNFKFITPKIFKMLNDQSADYDKKENEQNRKLIHQFDCKHIVLYHKQTKTKNITVINYLTYSNRRIPVIMPDSYFKIIWDIIVLIMIIINIFYIPMKLSFKLDESNANLLIDILLDTLPSWIFVIEIILNFNTACYHEGLIHEDRNEILKFYLQGDFIWDLIVVIPFLISRYNIPFMEFVLLMRVTRVASMFENLEQVTSIREKFATSLDLGKLIYFLIFVSHICACSWHYLGVLQLESSPDDVNWLLKNNLQDKDWFTRYVYSLYWSTITTLTVGYGEIVPVIIYSFIHLFIFKTNKNEMMFVIAMVLITSIVFGYTISSIQTIFAQMKEKSDTYKNKMAIINAYIKKSKLNQQLQIKVRKYFEYYLRTQLVTFIYLSIRQNESEELEGLMNQLNSDLKLEVNNDIFYPILKTCKIISEGFSNEFLMSLCQKIKIQKCIPGEVIFNQGELLNRIIFVKKGDITIYINRNEQKKKQFILKTYKKGSVVGSKDFVLKEKIYYSGKTSQFTELAYLDWEDFFQILSKYPKDWEHFAQIKDNLLFNSSYRGFAEQCEICNNYHTFSKCSFVFYQISQKKLQMENKQSDEQKREKMERFRVQKIKNMRINLRDKQYEALTVALDHQLIEEIDLDNDYLLKLGINTHDEGFESQRKQSDDRDSNEQNSEKHDSYNDEFTFKNNKKRIQNMAQQKKSSFKDLQSVKKGHEFKSQLSMNPNSSPNKNQNQQVMIQRYCDTLTQMYMDYLEIKKGDSIDGLDAKREFQNFYAYFNLSHILEKFYPDQFLFRKKMRYSKHKTELSQKLKRKSMVTLAFTKK